MLFQSHTHHYINIVVRSKTERTQMIDPQFSRNSLVVFGFIRTDLREFYTIVSPFLSP